MVGSSFYIAPEVLRGRYGFAADVWSAGVIVYIMLSGLPPFWGPNTRECFDNILTAEPRLDGDPWDGVSAAGKDFIRRSAAVQPLFFLPSLLNFPKAGTLNSLNCTDATAHVHVP
jgi:calcium-dependent protein kinase